MKTLHYRRGYVDDIILILAADAAVIDDLLKEKKIKTEFMSETINSLLDMQNTANSNASSTSGHTAPPAMNNGAVYKSQ